MPAEEKQQWPGWMKVILGLGIFISLIIFIHLNLSTNLVDFRADPEGRFRITDFLYHLLLVDAFWRGQIDSIYQLQAQQAIMSTLFAADVKAVMPIGASPTILLIWAPLTAIAGVDLAWANTVWVSGSLLVLGWACWQTDSRLPPNHSTRRWLYRGTLGIVIFSMTFLSALVLGQASILATGLLLFILLTLTANTEPNAWLLYVGFAGATVLLSVKVPYLIIALMLPVIFGRLGVGMVAGLGVAVALLGLIIWQGPAMVFDFLDQLGLYNQQFFPDYYAASIVFETTNTFRSAFAPIIGDVIALRVSQLVLAAGLAAIGLVSIGQQMGWQFGRQVTGQFLTILLIGLILLFLPYLGRYEELLWLVAISAAWTNPNGENKLGAGHILWLTGLVFVLNHTLLPLDKPLWPFWLIKFMIVLFLLRRAGVVRHKA